MNKNRFTRRDFLKTLGTGAAAISAAPAARLFSVRPRVRPRDRLLLSCLLKGFSTTLR